MLAWRHSLMLQTRFKLRSTTLLRSSKPRWTRWFVDDDVGGVARSIQCLSTLATSYATKFEAHRSSESFVRGSGLFSLMSFKTPTPCNGKSSGLRSSSSTQVFPPYLSSLLVTQSNRFIASVEPNCLPISRQLSTPIRMVVGVFISTRITAQTPTCSLLLSTCLGRRPSAMIGLVSSLF